MCGASSAQNQIEQQQQSFANQVQTQATQIFGQQSGIYQDLVNTFAPTVAAGPNQQGFSAGELSNLNSQAITNTGQAYKNEKQALGDQQAAAGGGRAVLPGGATIGTNLGLAENAGNQTANELGQINQANWSTGRQNYLNATQGLAGAGNVYGAAEGANSGVVGATSAAGNTANQIAQQNNSWVQAVTGALGGVASGFTGGILGSIGSGLVNSGIGGQLAGQSANAAAGLSTTSPTVNAGVGPTRYTPAPGF